MARIVINKPKVLGEYDNGNYHVTLYEDGTKIRENDKDFFRADFPESIDITVSKRCYQGCKYCYMGCSPSGKFADLSDLDHLLDSIHPYTELALNGNEITVELIRFLKECRSRNIICNLTVNQNYYLDPENYGKIQELLKFNLIRGLGISLTRVSNELIKSINHPNIVLHTIAGILTKEDLEKLSNHNIKLLILGFKQIGRGVTYQSNNSEELIANLEFLRAEIKNYINKFKVVSFDNLALEQLHIKDWLENWDEFYMGDEGKFTFYIDLVDKKYYKSSLESDSSGFSFDPEKDSVVEMFQNIRDNT